MNQSRAYKLFEFMIDVALREIGRYTHKGGLRISVKDDGTLVTEVDKKLDRVLGGIARKKGFGVISEEGENVFEQTGILKSGNYITIDPIDGTGSLKNHMGRAKRKGLKLFYIDPELGNDSRYDYCLLLGIVEDFIPRFGCCYNFVTQDNALRAET